MIQSGLAATKLLWDFLAERP